MLTLVGHRSLCHRRGKRDGGGDFMEEYEKYILIKLKVTTKAKCMSEHSKHRNAYSQKKKKEKKSAGHNVLRS